MSDVEKPPAGEEQLLRGPGTTGSVWHPVWGPRHPPRKLRLRRTAKRMLAGWLARGRNPADPARGVAILAYHGTGEDPADPWWLDFKGQMRLIADLGYVVKSLDEVVRLLDADRPPERPTLAITFDDGFSNNLRVAYPELARRGWPATVFIASSFIGRPPFLPAAEIPRLADFGITIGNHTHSHPNVRELDGEAITAEVLECGRRLEQLTGQPPRHFCYPYGAYSPAARDAVAATDLESACCGRVGYNPPRQDVFTLRRLTLERGDGVRELAQRLAGGYDFLDRRQRWQDEI